MEDIMSKISEMTLYGSIAIVMVIIFRAVFRKIPKKVTCLFWIAAAIRLMCPVNFSMGFGIANLFESEKVQTVDPAPVVVGQVREVAMVTEPVMKADVAAAQVRNVTEQPVASGADISISTVMLIIWIAGVAAGLIVLTVQYLRIRKLIREGKNENGIIISDKVDTPLVAGVFKPVIVLPEAVDKSERAYLLCHEKVHIKNRDNLTRAFGLFIAFIHWFNPLVWIAYKLMCDDLEMRVDEEVIDTIGNDIKKDYCMSIVNHAMTGSRYKVQGASFAKKTLSGREVKMRINNLINYKKISGFTALFIVAGTLGVTTVLSSCANAKEPAAEGSKSVNEETTVETTEEWTPPGGDSFFVDEEDSYVMLNSFKSSEKYDKEYVTDFGPQKELKNNEYTEIHAASLVTSDYYADTDLYNLAQQYEAEGYELHDIAKEYSMCGGIYFNEGFVATTNMAEVVNVVRTDDETLNRYLQEDYSILPDASIAQLTREGDGNIYNYTADYCENIGYDTPFEYSVNAKLDTSMNVAVIAVDYPDYGV